MINYADPGYHPKNTMNVEAKIHHVYGTVNKPNLERLVADIAVYESEQAFTDLHRVYAGRIKAYFMSKGIERGSADLLAQDVMICVWRQASFYNPVKQNVHTWIFTLSRDTYIQHRRGNSRIEPEDHEQVPAQVLFH